MSDTGKPPSDDFFETQHRHSKRCLREALTAGAIWLIAFAACCGVMISQGYVPADQRPDDPSLILGFPSWVFYGLVLPWITLVFIIWGFAVFVLKDDEPYQDYPSDEPGKAPLREDQS